MKNKNIIIVLTCVCMMVILLVPVTGMSATAYAEDNEIVNLAQIHIEGELSPESNKKQYTRCNVKVYGENGELIFEDENMMWRRHGNSTSCEKKCPYKLKFNKEISLFGMKKTDTWILMANAYDTSLMRNKLALDFATEIGLEYTSQCKYVEVYVNGDYRGNYLLVEPVEIGGNGVDIFPAANEFLLEINLVRGYSGIGIRTEHKKYTFELNGIDYLPQSQYKWLIEYMNNAELILKSKDINKISEVFDIDSFVDNYIVYEFTRNTDSCQASTRFYIKEGKIYAGPVWDFDLSMGNMDGEEYSTGYGARFLYWGDLMTCDWFRQKVAERYLELQPIIVNIYEDNELGQNRIDANIAEMGNSITKNFERWDITEVLYRMPRVSDPTYEENVEFLRQWAIGRNAWFLNEISEGAFG